MRRLAVRIAPNCKRKVIRNNKGAQRLPATSATLRILSDKWCRLYKEGCVKAKYSVRLIEALRTDTGETIMFITNAKTLTAVEVIELYKRRRDIEVFFKMLKQLFNFKHFLNRTANGIQVVLYVTMLAAILLIACKKENALKGFKIAKQKLSQELEIEIVKQLIVLCGGNPKYLPRIFAYIDP